MPAKRARLQRQRPLQRRMLRPCRRAVCVRGRARAAPGGAGARAHRRRPGRAGTHGAGAAGLCAHGGRAPQQRAEAHGQTGRRPAGRVAERRALKGAPAPKAGTWAQSPLPYNPIKYKSKSPCFKSVVLRKKQRDGRTPSPIKSFLSHRPIAGAFLLCAHGAGPVSRPRRRPGACAACGRWRRACAAPFRAWARRTAGPRPPRRSARPSRPRPSALQTGPPRAVC